MGKLMPCSGNNILVPDYWRSIKHMRKKNAKPPLQKKHQKRKPKQKNLKVGAENVFYLGALS